MKHVPEISAAATPSGPPSAWAMTASSYVMIPWLYTGRRYGSCSWWSPSSQITGNEYQLKPQNNTIVKKSAESLDFMHKTAEMSKKWTYFGYFINYKATNGHKYQIFVYDVLSSHQRCWICHQMNDVMTWHHISDTIPWCYCIVIIR